MKLPPGAEHIRLNSPENGTFFPPMGFLEIEESEDGSGDCFGLYWELGKESGNPVVCLLDHESFLLVPEYPSLISCLRNSDWWSKQNILPKEQDEPWFMGQYNMARLAMKRGELERSQKLLESSLLLFSEFSDAWALLSECYRLQGKVELAENAALRAIISNYVFGTPGQKAIDAFNMIDPEGHLSHHPLIRRQEGLISGASYSNPLTIHYSALKAAVAELWDLGEMHDALLLEQNLGYLLQLESSSEQEKQGFDKTQSWENFIQKIRQYYPARLL